MSAPEVSDRRRVALFGGSFDPPHLGHVLLATWALCKGKVEEVWVLPTWEHPFGKAMAPYEARCVMVEAAFSHLGPGVCLNHVERELGGTSYTVDTVGALRGAHPGVDFVWVCGADSWGQRRQWHQWERLEGLVEWLVVGREGQNPEPLPHDAPALPDISSSDLRKTLAAGGDVSGLVSPEVIEVIRKRRLYL